MYLLYGDKECPFSGVTSSGRVWRKVPESDARSDNQGMTIAVAPVSLALTENGCTVFTVVRLDPDAL